MVIPSFFPKEHLSHNRLQSKTLPLASKELRWGRTPASASRSSGLPAVLPTRSIAPDYGTRKKFSQGSNAAWQLWVRSAGLGQSTLSGSVLGSQRAV
jgi:hypothetical protein